MNHHAVGTETLLEAAVRDRINALCRQAYVHELRSGLQAIHSALELMARAGGVPDPSFAAKASALAKRAIAAHENAVFSVLDDIIAQQQPDAQALDLGQLARDCVRFLHNSAAARGVALLVDAEEDLVVHARRQPLRTALLGVMVSAVRDMADGSQLRLRALRRGGEAFLTFEGTPFCAVAPIPEPAGLASADLTTLMLPVAQRFIAADGGRLWMDGVAGGTGTLSIAYRAA